VKEDVFSVGAMSRKSLLKDPNKPGKWASEIPAKSQRFAGMNTPMPMQQPAVAAAAPKPEEKPPIQIVPRVISMGGVRSRLSNMIGMR
jgi:hypothetical protein